MKSRYRKTTVVVDDDNDDNDADDDDADECGPSFGLHLSIEFIDE